MSAGGSDFVEEFSAADEFLMLAGGGSFLSQTLRSCWNWPRKARLIACEGERVMPKLSNAQLLADRQRRAIDGSIQKIDNGVKQVIDEARGEERLGRILSLVAKAQAMNPNDDQMERMWSMQEKEAAGRPVPDGTCAVFGGQRGVAGLQSPRSGRSIVIVDWRPIWRVCWRDWRRKPSG